MKSVRILIVDDHALLREGLHGLISTQPDMEVVGEAENGLAAVQLAKQLLPDIVLMDVTMPKLDGLEATMEIKQSCPQVRVLVLSGHESTALQKQMHLAGASGYLGKTATKEVILSAIRQVAGGAVHFDPKVLTQTDGGRIDAPGRVPNLSHRETQVMRLLAQGYLAKEVATQLNVSTKSVETYKARLMLKLGINSRVELIRHAQVNYRTDLT